MNRFRLCVSALALMAAFSSSAWSEELPLKRVTLSTSGLAQFEHQGSVIGNAELTLPVRLDQVDDVLKSLVVLDNGGSFGGVTLPGREPLSQIFRDLPFDQAALQTSAGLLQALQGAEVQIGGSNPVTGKLTSVMAETQINDDGLQSTKHRIGIMAKDGLHTVLLEDLQSLQFTDPVVQVQLHRALTAIHDHRIQDQRTLTLDLRGEGARPVTVSYVTGAPLWKSAYRVVLPEKDSAKAYLQGWAILENTTGQDWDNVAVTLLSGNPVTYKQSLYESYYRDRPVLPLQVMGRLMPRTDTGSVPAPSAPAGAVMEGKAGDPLERWRKIQDERPKQAMAPMAAMADMAYADSGVAGGAPVMAEAAMNMAPAQSAVAEQATVQMVFRFQQAVTLPAGNSLMLPVISRDIPAEQVWLYQPETDARHPLASVALTNDSDAGLPPGILTLFEQTANGLRYTGDSELSLLPKGETRYVNFALDPATTIDREMSSERQFGVFKAAKGVVEQSVVSTETTVYTIKAPADEDRVIVIEHPRLADWELKAPEGLIDDPEKTETHYRLKLALKSGETKTLKVILERQDFESLSLGYMQQGDLASRLNAMGQSLDPKVRKALEGAIALQNDVYVLQNQIQILEQERQTIFNDQARVRGNLQSIPTGSDLAKRYLAELNAQEDRLKKLDGEQNILRQKQAAAQAKLDDYVAGLDL
ncbi:MAG: DUF4139 domain-containing protein [Micavibrio sp.]